MYSDTWHIKYFWGEMRVSEMEESTVWIKAGLFSSSGHKWRLVVLLREATIY